MAGPRYQVYLLIGICIISLAVSLPTPQDGPEDTLVQRLRSLKQRVYETVKRSCEGFPCMYSHLGAKAGRQALMRTLMSIIDDCASSPSCSPGRRRRRAESSLQGSSSDTLLQRPQ